MLSVINRYNVDHMIEIYRYAQERSIPLKMNPVFKVNAADHEEYLIDSATYVKNFQKLFDYWLCDSKATGNIEPIMQFLRMYFEKRGQNVSMVLAYTIGYPLCRMVLFIHVVEPTL